MKKTIKKISAYILTLLSCAVLTACYAPSQPPEPQPDDSDNPSTSMSILP